MTTRIHAHERLLSYTMEPFCDEYVLTYITMHLLDTNNGEKYDRHFYVSREAHPHYVEYLDNQLKDTHANQNTGSS